ELTERAETMGKAWASNDLVTMRRLTGKAQGRALRHWLNSHPAPPAQGKERGDDEVACDVRFVTRKADRVRLALSVHGSSGITMEVQQTWVKEDNEWVFQPTSETKKQASVTRK